MNHLNLTKFFSRSSFHIIFLFCLLLIVFLFWLPRPMNDGGNYQMFIEKIADQGKIDFTIPGFHGADFLGLIVYLITGSHYSVYLVDILAALLTLPLIYLVVKQIYQDEFLAVIATYILALMPFQVFNSLRGGYINLHLFLVLITLYLLFKNKDYSWIILGISYITYPFSITLIPFYVYKKKIKQLLLSFIIPAFYLLAQFLQIGRIMIGQHPQLSAQQLFSFQRFLPNIIYSIQNYLSVHNFSPFNPLYNMDMIHFSPFITIFAVIGVFYFKNHFNNKKMFYTLLSFAIFSFLLPASFYRMDMYYFWMFNLSLIFLSLPVIVKYQRLMPLVAFTFSYQFFYFFLSYKILFTWPHIVFIVPLIIFMISLIYTLKTDTFKIIKHLL